MAIIDTIQGWQVEEGDFIVIINDELPEEVEVKAVEDDTLTVYSHTTGDVYKFDIHPDWVFEVWGE
jgi:hypothetical protein